MDQRQLPIYDALIAFSNKKPLSFHVPGHKNGKVFLREARHLYEALLTIDVTELSGLDDLHNPTGIIKDAQHLAAQLYRSKQCFFLVGGSTVGNLAMVMATCRQGDTVLVQRNSHKSIMNALKLTKVTPIFIEPQFDDVAQVATCLDERIVIEAIKKYPHAKALILTRPNYYGYTNEIKLITKVAHENEIAVLVDEAHGAHFGHQSPLLPISAVSEGADIVVQSAHKTLPAMTMGSYLQYNSNGLVDLQKLKYYLQLFQSSSPSYPLMASLDIARCYLAMLSNRDLELTVEKINNFKALLNTIPQLKVIESNHYVIDPLKVTIQSNCQLSGFELQALFEEHGIYTELADRYNVLLVMPLVIHEDLVALAEKMKRIVKNYPATAKLKKANRFTQENFTFLDLSYEEIEHLEEEVVCLHQSVDRIISEAIIPYPPGIPLLLSGERMTANHLEQIYILKETGAYFQGTDLFQKGVKVFKY